MTDKKDMNDYRWGVTDTSTSERFYFSLELNKYARISDFGHATFSFDGQQVLGGGTVKGMKGTVFDYERNNDDNHWYSIDGNKLFEHLGVSELSTITDGFYNFTDCDDVYHSYVESCKDNAHIIASVQCVAESDGDTGRQYATVKSRVFLIDVSDFNNPQYIDLVSIIEDELEAEQFSWDGVSASCFK